MADRRASDSPAAVAPFEAILNTLADAAYATDQRGAITYFNEAAAELWGARPELGATLWCGSLRLYRPDGTPLPHDQSPMAVCIAENRSLQNVELVVERADGVKKPVLVNPRPIRDAHGVLIGAVNTFVEPTEARSVQHALQTAQMFTRQVLANSPDCIKVLDLDGKLQSINQCGCISLEVDDPEKARGLSYFAFWDGADQDLAKAAADRAMQHGAGQFTAPYVSTSGRRTLWEEMISVIRDPEGQPTGFLVISRDITERQRASDEQARRLRQQRAVSELGTFALEEEHFTAVMERAVQVAAEVLEAPLAGIFRRTEHDDRLVLQAGAGWATGLVGSAHVDGARDSLMGFTFSSDEPVVFENLQTETRFRGPPLLTEHGVCGGMSVKIAGSGGRPFGLFCVHTTSPRQFDSADSDFLTALANVVASRARQAEAQERRQLLIKEMAHRSGNALQLASAIFQQTLKTTPDVREAQEKFATRLSALSRANMLLASGGWSDTSLRRLVDETLEPFLSKAIIEGPDLQLPSDLCFDLSLLLHELSTNSAKYGAFSGDSGKVEIRWRVRQTDEGQPHLHIVWRDKSGKPAGVKTGTGFGSKLLSQIVERKWAGAVSVHATPHYECKLSVPLEPANETAEATA